MSENKITMQLLHNEIVDVKYTNIIERKLTHCCITVKNGFAFTGESAVVDPENYIEELGQQIAHKNAIDKMFLCYGFMLQEDLYRETISNQINQ